MLKLQDITVDYGEGVVLDRLSLELRAGAIHGLVGRNGEGKTTLLNAIYGTVRPQEGTVQWQGSPVTAATIAYLETELYFYPMITGGEYLDIFETKNSLFDRSGWNEIFELPLEEYISVYSTGMKKKLALLAIFALDRPCLMLDEPFNGLDLESNLLLSRILRHLAQSGKTILVTSHIFESLSTLCDEVHWLNRGKIERTFTANTMHELKEEILRDLNDQKMPVLRSLLSVG